MTGQCVMALTKVQDKWENEVNLVFGYSKLFKDLHIEMYIYKYHTAIAVLMRKCFSLINWYSSIMWQHKATLFTSPERVNCLWFYAVLTISQPFYGGQERIKNLI